MQKYLFLQRTPMILVIISIIGGLIFESYADIISAFFFVSLIIILINRAILEKKENDIKNFYVTMFMIICFISIVINNILSFLE